MLSFTGNVLSKYSTEYQNQSFFFFNTFLFKIDMLWMRTKTTWQSRHMVHYFSFEEKKYEKSVNKIIWYFRKWRVRRVRVVIDYADTVSA